MKAFLLYTLARLLLFLIAFGLIWAIFGHWLEWTATTILYTAVIALVVSSIAALLTLGRLRDEFARHVERRAHRMSAAIEARRAAEDAEGADADAGTGTPPSA